MNKLKWVSAAPKEAKPEPPQDPNTLTGEEATKYRSVMLQLNSFKDFANKATQHKSQSSKKLNFDSLFAPLEPALKAVFRDFKSPISIADETASAPAQSAPATSGLSVPPATNPASPATSGSPAATSTGSPAGTAEEKPIALPKTRFQSTTIGEVKNNKIYVSKDRQTILFVYSAVPGGNFVVETYNSTGKENPRPPAMSSKEIILNYENPSVKDVPSAVEWIKRHPKEEEVDLEEKPAVAPKQDLNLVSIANKINWKKV